MKGLIEILGRKLKIILLKLTKKNIFYGRGVLIDFQTNIRNNRNILKLGNNVYLRSISRGYQAAMPFSTTILIDVEDAQISIGNNTRINGAYIHAQKSILIGDNCVIASGVNILDSNGHQLCSNNRTKGRDKPEDIVIQENVWIGINCVILKGTIIGKNSVVSAGTIVKGIFPPNSLISCNMGHVVKKIVIDDL